MNKKEEKKGFHFVYHTEEDTKREIEERVSKLTEDQKSEFIFDGHSLYAIGGGHCFAHGYYYEYITKTGIKARCYGSKMWHINNDSYDYVNNEFIIIPKQKHEVNTNPIDFSDISFPIIKNCGGRTIAEDLISVRPI